METFANQGLSTCDTVLWGHATDEMMRAYWPTMLDNLEATAYERNQAAWIEQVQKVVCSRSLKKADWHNTQLITDNLIEE